jgi:hypothetical protein
MPVSLSVMRLAHAAGGAATPTMAKIEANAARVRSFIASPFLTETVPNALHASQEVTHTPSFGGRRELDPYAHS